MIVVSAVCKSPDPSKNQPMLSQRVKAAVIFTPLVLILIYLGGWVFNLFIAAALLLAAFEFTRLFDRMGYQPALLVVLAGILTIFIHRWIFGLEHLDILISVTITLVVGAGLAQYESGFREAGISLAINLGIMFYLGWIGSFFISLRAHPDGLGWILTALPATWLADMGAYFIGRWLGRRKLAPRLSPGKTLAGLAGAVVAGTLSGILLILLWRASGFLPDDTPLWQGAVMGLTLALLTPLGDLLVSLFKRSADVKDTGSIIPGHGGILDRIDTWIWAAMLGYYLVVSFNTF